MTERNIISDLATLQEYLGSCAPSLVEFRYGELAIDVIGSALAEELLAALRGRMSEEDARTVVGLLLDNRLTFDDLIDGEADDAQR